MRVSWILTSSLLPWISVCAFHTVALTRKSPARTPQFMASVASELSPDLEQAAAKLLQHVDASAAREYADMFGLSQSDAAFYALFCAIRQSQHPIGIRGKPLVVRANDLAQALNEDSCSLQGFFTFEDLAQALDDDFLDAARGSTDNRRGWQITTVSNPRGDSFEEARMTLEDVTNALEKGTVIFNAAGAHIPSLAAPSLACTDATDLPCALNLYVTAPHQRTSAPPHTDKQDVVVCQSTGCKHWKVYAPPPLKATSDVYSRGKNDDALPLHLLDQVGDLLLETTLTPGDVLLIPAGFPHTTSTLNTPNDVTSVHLTFGLDSHVWDFDYVSTRRLALRRACVVDSALGQEREEDNVYLGAINELPRETSYDLLNSFPMGFLQEDATGNSLEDTVVHELMRISQAVDETTFAAVDESVWRDTVHRVRQQGIELLEIHRDMYLAAIEEGRLRKAEDEMTAHLESGKRRTMSPERMQRLSLFRVQRYYEKINESKQSLLEWSYAGTPSSSSEGTAALPSDWAFTMPVKVGDQVEADLGGAFFPATVTRIVPGDKYAVRFFDGDEEMVERSGIKLMVPPPVADDNVDTSKMTKKQLKRWKKQQEKKLKHGL